MMQSITSDRQRKAMFARMSMRTQSGYRTMKQKRKFYAAGAVGGAAIALGFRVARAPLTHYGIGLAKIYGIGKIARYIGTARSAVVHNVSMRRFKRTLRNPKTTMVSAGVYMKPSRDWLLRKKLKEVMDPSAAAK